MKIALTISLGALLFGCAGNASDPPCDRTVVGNICTIAGTGQSGYAGEEGPALEASLVAPMDTLTAPDGTLYVLDWGNHRIRRITQDGVIHFVAGNGELGSIDSPETGNLNHPTGMIFDPTGTLIYVAAWHNSKIRILDLSTNLLVDSCGDGRRAYFGDDGPAKTASLDLPASIAWDPQNNLTIMDQANQVIRSVDAEGNIHRIAGNCVVDAPAPEGPGACAAGVKPTACPPPSNKTVCGDPAMFCGKSCSTGYTGDEIPASELRMSQGVAQRTDPGGHIIYDKAGNLYFADAFNHMIRVIDTQGIVHRFAGLAPVEGQPAIGGFSGDGGPALQAQLHQPIDLAFGDDGTLYVSDLLNHCVRAIAPDKTIRTVAGICGTRGNADQIAPSPRRESGIPAVAA